MQTLRVQIRKLAATMLHGMCAEHIGGACSAEVFLCMKHEYV